MAVDIVRPVSVRAASAWPALAAAAIFLAASLLFTVELLIAKLILPWFGGSAAVWLACLLFFQIALLAGYLYAHLLAAFLSPAMQAQVHSVLLVASLIFLPIVPSETWKPLGDENPLPLIVGLLAGTIGLPFVLLASSTPLLQAWLSRGTLGAGSIYRLYALSNLGSMLALLSYPVLIEPALPSRAQALAWSAAYALFAGLSIGAAFLQRGLPVPQRPSRTDGEKASIADILFWVLLPMAASALLLAVSNHILRNIVALPLFWVVPLALYLLSFIVAFDRSRWYFRPLFLPLFALFAALVSRLYAGILPLESVAWMVGLFSAALFVFCMVCHGELARLKPAPSLLTAYYLCIAAGGALGGLLIAALAPLLLKADVDFALFLPVTAALAIAAVWRSLPKASRQRLVNRAALAGAVLILCDFTWAMAARQYADLAGQVELKRNFYGALGVEDSGGVRSLWNGNVIHGRQYIRAESWPIPMSYYARTSGVAVALGEVGKAGPIRVGAIGLGAGTLGAYARPGDFYRFYEINPAVTDIAQRHFHYLDLCSVSCEVVHGDARLSLEREAPQGYDLLAVDAFNSDSIPVHLLTREAFTVYARHLKPGGVIAVHTSNKFVDLPPLVALAAREAGKTARLYSSSDVGVDTAEWILIAEDASFFARPTLRDAVEIAAAQDLRPWTDDYSSLWRALR